MSSGALRASTFVIALTILGLLTSSAWAVGPVDFSLRVGGQQPAQADTTANAAMNLGLDYRFVQIYSIGVNLAYVREASKIQTDTSRGYQDILIYLADQKLWANPFMGFTLSGKLGFISPVSYISQQASETYALMQSLTATQKFSDRFNLNLVLTATEYDYEYDTVDPTATDDKEVFNNILKVTVRTGFAFDILRSLHWTTNAWVHTFRNSNDQSTEVRGVGTTLAFDFTKLSAIDFGVSSAYKVAGPGVWDGPLYHTLPFHRNGVLFTFGTSLKI